MERRLPFLDTNIFVRHLAADEPDHSPRATNYLDRIQRGEVAVRTAITVVFETVFVAERLYQFPRRHIREVLIPLLDLPGIVLPEKDDIRATFDLWVDHPALSFADCHHVALMKHLQLTEIISFDQGFDRIDDITRIEP
jgi:predicted nucleic acid-binding protein